MNTVNDIVLSSENLCVQADNKLLLDNISLTISKGEVLGVIGPNGAGKSTLLKILAGINQASSGKVMCEGQTLHTLPPEQRARNIAWLEQRPVMHWPLSVRQVIALGRLPHRQLSNTQTDTTVIDEAMAFTGIAHLQHRAFPDLSEGEKLLVNLARVLATQSKVILADEPTSALDPKHQLLVMDLLQQLAAQGTSVIVVLHDLTLAARYCQRLLLLHNGAMQACGSPADILTEQLLAQVYGIDAYLDASSATVIYKNKPL